MNDNSKERDILLAETNELPPARMLRLQRMLASDTKAAAFQRDLRRIAEAARAASRPQRPSSRVEAAIVAEAVRHHERAPRRLIFPRPAIGLAACAAGLALVVSGWFAFSPTTTPGDPVAEIQTILAMLDADSIETGSLPRDAAANGERLRAVARQLLTVQGLDSEDTTLLETDTWDELPTTLRASPTPAASVS